MNKRTTPPIGLKVDLTKEELRNFGSKQMACRLIRGSDGRWYVSKSGANFGYIVFIDRVDTDVPAMPENFTIQITETRRTAGFASLCT